MAPSAPQSRTWIACSGPEMPNPTATGVGPMALSCCTRPATRDSIVVRTPVTPVTLTR